MQEYQERRISTSRRFRRRQGERWGATEEQAHHPRYHLQGSYQERAMPPLEARPLVTRRPRRADNHLQVGHQGARQAVSASLLRPGRPRRALATGGVVPQHERPLQSPAMDDRGPSPRDTPSQVRGSGKGIPDLRFLTLNINAWAPFRDRWSEEGQPAEFQSATLLLLQEHHLTTEEQCSDAVEWCAARGWDATFRKAIQLPSGKPPGGAAILVSHRADIGVTDPQLSVEGMEHRLLALQLTAPGLERTLVVAAYLQAGGGLNHTNRTLLATLAQWQEEVQAPILAGGDFNLRPEQVQSTDFLTRSGLQLVVPPGPTYRTSKSCSTIDYYIASQCICNKLHGCDVLRGFPLKPHSPVELKCTVGALEWIPVMDTPTRLPTERPYGPSQEEVDWSPLAATVNEGHQHIDTYKGSQWENVQVLDQVYDKFVRYFEQQVCLCTDTPQRRTSTRGRPPRIRWIEGHKKAERQLKSWRSLDRPLVWMTIWVQNVIRYVSGHQEEGTTAGYLEQDLQECPTEFRSVPALIGLHQQAQLLAKALVADEAAQRVCKELNEEAFTHFLGEVNEALEQERRALQKGHLRRWREWVREAEAHHKGWAHRWTTTKEQWKAVRVPAGGTFTGRPRDALEAERRRLQEVWRCSEESEPWFQADDAAAGALPPLSVQEFLQAARSFPRRTASTWDGFHPRHYGLLGERHAAVVLELILLIERVGIMPTTLQAIYAKLIPKHKGVPI